MNKELLCKQNRSWAVYIRYVITRVHCMYCLRILGLGTYRHGIIMQNSIRTQSFGVVYILYVHYVLVNVDRKRDWPACFQNLITNFVNVWLFYSAERARCNVHVWDELPRGSTEEDPGEIRGKSPTCREVLLCVTALVEKYHTRVEDILEDRKKQGTVVRCHLFFFFKFTIFPLNVLYLLVW